VVVIGVKIDIGSKLSQPSPLKKRGGTTPFIDKTLKALHHHADRQTETLTVTPIP